MKTDNARLNVDFLLAIAFFHAGAAVAIFYYGLSYFWIALLIWPFSHGIGLAVGYHRLLTHRGFKASINIMPVLLELLVSGLHVWNWFFHPIRNSESIFPGRLHQGRAIHVLNASCRSPGAILLFNLVCMAFLVVKCSHWLSLAFTSLALSAIFMFIPVCCDSIAWLSRSRIQSALDSAAHALKLAFGMLYQYVYELSASAVVYSFGINISGFEHSMSKTARKSLNLSVAASNSIVSNPRLQL
jgi:hypothetical protein